MIRLLGGKQIILDKRIISRQRCIRWFLEARFYVTKAAYLLIAGITACVTTPSLFDADSLPQGFLHTRHTLYQLSYVPCLSLLDYLRVCTKQKRHTYKKP